CPATGRRRRPTTRWRRACCGRATYPPSRAPCGWRWGGPWRNSGSGTRPGPSSMPPGCSSRTSTTTRELARPRPRFLHAVPHGHQPAVLPTVGPNTAAREETRNDHSTEYRARPRRVGGRLVLERRHQAPAGRWLPRYRAAVPDDRAGRRRGAAASGAEPAGRPHDRGGPPLPRPEHEPARAPPPRTA